MNRCPDFLVTDRHGYRGNEATSEPPMVFVSDRRPGHLFASLSTFILSPFDIKQLCIMDEETSSDLPTQSPVQGAPHKPSKRKASSPSPADDIDKRLNVKINRQASDSFESIPSSVLT